MMNTKTQFTFPLIVTMILNALTEVMSESVVSVNRILAI